MLSRTVCQRLSCSSATAGHRMHMYLVAFLTRFLFISSNDCFFFTSSMYIILVRPLWSYTILTSILIINFYPLWIFNVNLTQFRHSLMYFCTCTGEKLNRFSAVKSSKFLVDIWTFAIFFEEFLKVICEENDNEIGANFFYFERGSLWLMYMAMKSSGRQLCHALLSWYHIGIPLTCSEVNQLMTTASLGF